MAVRAGSPVWQELLGSESGPLSARRVVGGPRLTGQQMRQGGHKSHFRKPAPPGSATATECNHCCHSSFVGLPAWAHGVYGPRETFSCFRHWLNA